METYDVIMLAVLGVAAIFGAIKGFAWQLASLASITLSYWVALKFREPFSQRIQAEPPWNRFLAMLILFVGTGVAVWLVFRMISGTIDRFRLREFDRQVGAIFGLAKGAIYCVLITMFSVTLLGDKIREHIVESRSGYYITKALDHSTSVIPEEIHEVIGPYLERFEARFRGEVESTELMRLPSSVLERVPEAGTVFDSSGAGDRRDQARLPTPSTPMR